MVVQGLPAVAGGGFNVGRPKIIIGAHTHFEFTFTLSNARENAVSTVAVLEHWM